MVFIIIFRNILNLSKIVDDKMQLNYRKNINYLLINSKKSEGLVFNTNTSQSPKMKVYYAYWERQIFSALSDVNHKRKKQIVFFLT